MISLINFCKQKISKNSGLTLIELMIAVSIIAIIAVIAVPTYRSSQQRARRAECTEMLTLCSKLQKTHYSLMGSYANYFRDNGTNGSDALDKKDELFPGGGNGYSGDKPSGYYYDYGIVKGGAVTDSLDLEPPFGTDAAHITDHEADLITDAGSDPYRCFCVGNIDGYETTLDSLTIGEQDAKPYIWDPTTYDDIAN